MDDEKFPMMTPDDIRACLVTLLMKKFSPPEGVTFTVDELKALASGPDHKLIVRLNSAGSVHVKLMTAEEAMWLNIGTGIALSEAVNGKGST